MKNRKTITRRNLLKKTASTAAAGGLILGFPALTRSAQAKKYIKPLVAGLNAKEGDPTDISLRLIPKILKEKYDVEMEIQIHPLSTLGTDVSQLESVQTGFIDITSNATSQFGVFDDAFNFMDLPYIIPNWDTGFRLFKSDLWKQQAAKFEKNVPIKVLPAVGAGGHRMLWNHRRPLQTPADAKGLKFRSTRSELVIEMFKSWGANPTPIPWVETYTALKQGVVDGYHVQAIWTFIAKMYEVLKYATEVNAIFAVQFQVLNGNTWASMPEAIQKPFMLAAQEAADIANKKDQELEIFFKGKLKEVGMKIYTPSKSEFSKWESAARTVWSGAGKSVPKSVIDAAVALQG